MKTPHLPTPAERLRRMHDQLAQAYGPQHWWPAETAFEVVLGAYLTQNTAWKAADAILLYALGHPVPVADEYLRRIVARHGLIEPAPGRNHKGYEALANLTRQAFASDAAENQARLFNEFHALTVAVGKAYCRRTARCAGCPLASDPHVTDDL